MLNTLVMAGMGFLFWLINAHLFSPDEIGLATTLISAMTLVSYTSLLGFNSTFIRFLPTAKNKDGQMTAGLLLSAAAALIIAGTYVLLVPVAIPELGLIHHPFYGAGFVILTALASLNLLTDSIFIALRAAKYNLLANGFIMSPVKVLLPVAFAGMGAYGIFAASGAAAAVAACASLLFLYRKFGFRPSLHIDKHTLGQVRRYSSSTYIANLLNIAPALLIPVITLNRLGAPSAAYYYLAFMIANLLYSAAYAVSQSLFAEGSYENRAFKELAKKAGAILAAVTVAGAAVTAGAAPLLLRIFGSEYSVHATALLRVMALAAPAVALYAVATVLLRLKKQTYPIILTEVIYVGTVCGLGVVWASRGLAWIGLAWLAGNALSGLTGFAFLRNSPG
jgi:O-antigen/teichoic acid export membrane protein